MTINCNNNPLVSVRILTYNSSEFVIEALDSIKAQTYSNIELIVSDDCSTDKTIELCENWIKNNQERFVRCVLLTSPVNTGIAPNSKRSLNVVQGEWIKGLAADDCLVENAIETFVKFVIEHACNICVSGMIRIDEHGQEIETVKGSVYYSYLNKLKKTHKRQLYSIYNKLFIPGPATFYSHKLLLDIGGYNDLYPFADEWPFFFNVLNKGYRIYPLEQKLIKYRVHQSISHQKGVTGLVNSRVINSTILFYKKEVRKSMIQKMMFISLWHSTIYFWVKKEQMKGNNIQFKLLLLLFIFSPKFYLNSIVNMSDYFLYSKRLFNK